MPANIELSGMEVLLVNVMSREKVLKPYLDDIKRDYDYMLPDCMPSLGIVFPPACVVLQTHKLYVFIICHRCYTHSGFPYQRYYTGSIHASICKYRCKHHLIGPRTDGNILRDDLISWRTAIAVRCVPNLSDHSPIRGK